MIYIIPRNDRVLVERLPDLEGETLAQPGGTIIKPMASKLSEGERPMMARVLAVGPGRMLDTGTRVEIDLEPGDIVIVARYAGHLGPMLPGAIHPALCKDEEVLAKVSEHEPDPPN